jgi:dihydrodipicolinate synthase/N-acetylneuraminate lyase
MTDGVSIISRNYTPFAEDKSLDEAALRLALQRFRDARISVYLGSGGSGEANALTREELVRVYEIGVEVFAGFVPVYANIPEVSTAAEAIEYAHVAMKTGVDLVNMYGPASMHGFVPNDRELDTYFDEVLSAIDYPVVVAPNPIQGYTPTPAVIAGVVARHAHVTGVNLVGLKGDSYFLELRELLERDVDVNVGLSGSLNTLGLGGRGVICNLANILPKTVRRYVDLYEAGEPEVHQVYADLDRFSRYVNTTAWRNPRWQKMAAQVLGLPGAAGGMRRPFLMPPAAEVERFARGLQELGIPELEVLFAAAPDRTR